MKVDCGRLTPGRLLSAAAAVVALGVAIATPAGASGNPNLEKLILSNPVPGWTNSTPAQDLPTAQAETLYYATEDWTSPAGSDQLIITLLDDPAYPFPKAEDLAHVVCGSGAVVLTESSVAALADSIQITCKSAAGVESAAIVWRQGNYLPEVRVTPTAGLGISGLQSVARRQSAFIAAAPAAGSTTSTSELHKPLVLVGLGLIVVLVIVLLVLLRRDRRRAPPYPVLDGTPPGGPLGGPPPSVPLAPLMPSSAAVAPLVDSASVAANGELPPFPGHRPDAPVGVPGIPATAAAGTQATAAPLPMAQLSLDDDLPPFSAVRGTDGAGGPAPAPDPHLPAQAPPTGPAAVAPPVPTVPPGWHRDPGDGTLMAYWDGRAWTQRRRWDGRAWVDVV